MLCSPFHQTPHRKQVFRPHNIRTLKNRPSKGMWFSHEKPCFTENYSVRCTMWLLYFMKPSVRGSQFRKESLDWNHLELSSSIIAFKEKKIPWYLSIDSVTVMNDSQLISRKKIRQQPLLITIIFQEQAHSQSQFRCPNKTILLSLLPLPMAAKTGKNINTKQHSVILTVSPLKINLEIKEIKRKEKLLKDCKKAAKKNCLRQNFS